MKIPRQDQVKSLVKRIIHSLFLILLLPSTAVLAQPNPSVSPTPSHLATLNIATHEAPPFAIKHRDGSWSGLAIDLWRDVAKDQGLTSNFVEVNLDMMISGVESGKYAASIGALTVTPEREARIDFTYPYYTTGFGVAVGKAPPSWLTLVRNFFTLQFLSAALMLGGVLLIIGFLFWLVERRANKEEFDEGWRGIGSGFWFSAVTMTTVGYGDKAPKTAAGKVIAIVWMFTAVIIISVFTGLIASALTESRVGGTIHTQDDLASASVGSIQKSSSAGWLDGNNITFRSFATIKAGLDAVKSGDIQAFVYDRPLLRYVIHNDYDGQLRLLPGTFGQQDYAFALPQGSPRREAINLAILRQIESPEWGMTVRETLGKDE